MQHAVPCCKDADHKGISFVVPDSRQEDGDVQIDETLIAGYSEGNVGRSLEGKSAVLIAVEDIGDGRTGNSKDGGH